MSINMKAFFFRAKAMIARLASQFSPPPRKLSPSATSAATNPPSPRLRLQNLSSLNDDVSSQTLLLFHLEEAVLRPTTLFPYFMVVAFEAGGLLRALLLLLAYPLVCLAGQELGLKVMVFVSFFGLRKRDFRAGRAMFPKFLLEDIAVEGLDVVMRFERRVGLTNLPRIMVESFMVDYLGVEAVFGRELKEVCGYFVGLMEEKKETDQMVLINHIVGEEKADSRLVGFCGLRKSLDHHHQVQQLVSNCKVVYMVSENEKRNWQVLPREKYPKPLIFHDGRLAFKPNFVSTIEMFTWLPFGLFLFMTRLFVALSLPHKLSIPILSFTGMKGTIQIHDTKTKTKTKKTQGTLYVCNHRTLLDPIYLSMALNKPLMAVTYSLSKVSETLSPIKTVRLTRDRSKDSETMERLLRQSDLVVCPEGTTCREPYLLRFSPLFAELADDIVPVAVDYGVGMFYGTTAGGHKFMDPVFLLLNPTTNCRVNVLEGVPQELTCGVGGNGKYSKFEVANYVQGKIGEALGFECTNLTRKDKYIVLAGNEGRVKVKQRENRRDKLCS